LQGVCHGDSGGPLVFNTRAPDDPVGAGKSRDDRLAGVTSWGAKCGFPTTPGVFTRLTTYTDWLNCMVKSKGARQGKGVGLSGVVVLLCTAGSLMWRHKG
jgi:secreted trypsin-like serine protease